MYVAIYECGQRYGGPEEGGWFFGWGMPVDAAPFIDRAKGFSDKAKALSYRDNLQRWLVNNYPEDTAERPGRVWLEAIVSDSPPAPFPEKVPYYE